MCVDGDCHEQDEDSADNLIDNNGKPTPEAIVESEICRSRETGYDGVKWLELEELDIDDAKLLELALPSKCPVVPAFLSLYQGYVSFDLLSKQYIFYDKILTFVVIPESICSQSTWKQDKAAGDCSGGTLATERTACPLVK